MNQPIIKALILPAFLIMLSACGGGGGGGGSVAAAPTSSPTAEQAPSDSSSYNPAIDGFPPVPMLNRGLASCRAIAANPAASTITGQLLFERVNLSAAAGRGLDYTNITQQPSRGVVVEAVRASGGSCSDTIVDATLTDGAGHYGLVVAAGQSVCIRARAQMASAITSAASWSFNVTDNTRSNSPYYLMLSSTPVVAPVSLGGRVATSGWNSSTEQYDSPRAAAPFAILDTACDTLDTVLQRNSAISLSELNIRWSENNKTLEGDLALGEIGGPFYSLFRITRNGFLTFSHNIFLLGDADADTDEYDQHVIAHEIAHFISQDQARSDSVGGSHGINDLLDMSVAFDEGFASAFSGIALAGVISDPALYRDTDGVGQQRSFSFYLDRRFGSHAGWYSESSVHNFVYNAFDANNGGADSVSLGFEPIYKAWMDQRNTDASVSLFSFINSLKSRVDPGQVFGLDMLAAAENLELVNDDFGSNEDPTNNPEISMLADVDPIYLTLSVGTPAVAVCSNPQGQRQNGISVYRRLVLNIPTTRSYTFTLSPQDSGKPKLIVERRGTPVISDQQPTAGAVLSTRANLSAGDYVVRIADIDNASADEGSIATRCFNLSVI